jgi:hydrogenase maturation protein HypF
MAENGVSEPVIGVALDGTGYGLDGRIWGGEVLVADLRGFRRAAHLEYLPLPGGDAAIHNPCRIAVAYLHTLLGSVPDLPFLSQMGPDEVKTVVQMCGRHINAPLTSSCGRLFDAVAALCGVRGRATYEAQAAIELEMQSSTGGDPYNYVVDPTGQAVEWGDVAALPRVSSREVRLAPMFVALVEDVVAQEPVADIGGRFHATVASMVTDLCQRISQETGLRRVALSGGCFQNRLLLAETVRRLRETGLEPLLHRQVPCNDGGVSLGQAVIGHHMLERDENAVSNRTG